MKMKRIIQTIKAYNVFLISSHVNLDPDALCSELALAIFLKSLGKKVLIVNNEAVPERLRFLPGVKLVKTFREGLKVSYDVAIILDCGELSRIGRVRNLIMEGGKLINIDHHITNDFFGHLNLVDAAASSTSEVLFELFIKMNCKFTDNLAFHLYAGIMTDTGSFRYENTSARTHEITAKLMQYNFSAANLYRQLYEMIPLKDFKEFTKVTSQFDELFSGKAVCVELRHKVLSKFSEGFDLRDAIFKFLRSIKNSEVFIIFTEDASNVTRVNFRSAGRVDVAEIARSFNGGGHHNASGCIISKNFKKTRNVVLRKIKEVL